MIREILEQYFDSGDLPKLEKSEDPFWDPPNPILIGQSYLSLGALGYACDSELEASILSIDGTAGRNGTLKIAYEPCDAEGNIYDEEDIPEELLVETADELLGVKNYYFKVSVKQANQLPKNLSKNAFVTYQFKFDKGESYQTKETNNKDGGNIHFWNYDKVHCIEEVTPTIIQEIKEGSISFQIYAYPPSNV